MLLDVLLSFQALKPEVPKQQPNNSDRIEVPAQPFIPSFGGAGRQRSVYSPELQRKILDGEATLVSFTLPEGEQAPTPAPVPVLQTPSLAEQVSTGLELLQKPKKPVRKIIEVPKSATDFGYLFEGGSNSPLAIMVGTSEGTRTYNGGKTQHYKSHIDPGNKAVNQGSFSYQHSAAGPEDADAKQLKRLQGQAAALMQQANDLGISAYITEFAFAMMMDLCTQSPTSCLGSTQRPRSRGLMAYLADEIITAKDEGRVIDTNYLDTLSIDSWAEIRAATYIDTTANNWTSTGLKRAGVPLSNSTFNDQKRRTKRVQEAYSHYLKTK